MVGALTRWKKRRTPASDLAERQRRLRHAVIQLGAAIGRQPTRLHLMWYLDMLEDGHPFAQAMDDTHNTKGLLWED